MIPEIREKFNSCFKQENFNKFINNIQKVIRRDIDFRICETPLFLDTKTTDSLINAANDIADQVKQIISDDFADIKIPEKYIVPNEGKHPLFLQIDFALTLGNSNDFLPQLIELQGFPSLYNFQAFIDQKIREYFEIPSGFRSYFNDLNYNSYIELLKTVMIGEHEPENVILLEINPKGQKTWIDFFLAEKQLGIKSICISDVMQRGNNLFYKKDNIEVPIERIYNRVIFDELETSPVKPSFNFYDDLNVEWLSHPNWFFKISKNILPMIRSKYSPQSIYLNELNEYPENLSEYVLKPLYSFAGSGVKIDITKELLDGISNKQNYILQKKVEYAPVIKTPDGYSKTEIRMMYLWKDKQILVNNLLRVSKGKMIGVDYNKNKTWVGANIVYHR
ncbi:hypothetical protein BMS3Abin04_02824 [bacterium BMS3Abin04]|nr:hypothetical protein BMS3Abin04_02824 [bacterium BMS3Abin04]